MGTVRDSRSGTRLKLEAAWTLRAGDLALAPNLKKSFVVHRRDPVTGRSLETVAVLVITGAATGRLILAYPPAPPVELIATSQPFGGLRWWFVCPDGHGRCSTLVRPAGETSFAPRKAWGPTSYGSQRMAPRRRAAERAARLRIALGGSANITAPFPAKPPGMHLRTYERLTAEAEAAAAIALGGRRLPITTRMKP